MIAKAYASRTTCLGRPPSEGRGGNRLPNEAFKQSIQGLLDPTEIDWLMTAARLPGKSMHLAVLLVFLANAEKTRQVGLSNTASQQFGLDRNVKYRALGWLETAGLICVERKRGRSPVVTMLDPDDSP